MYRQSFIIILLFTVLIIDLSAQLAQHTINYNDNPAAGYIRATWYNSPAFFVIDNNGFNKYENDNVQMQNYLKYLGKNRWIQLVGQTYYVYNENLQVIDSIKNPYANNIGRMIDWHDVIKLVNGHYLLLLYETKEMDLSKIVDGGDENASVIGNMLVETDRTGQIYWEWSVFDHFEITDLVDYYDLRMNIIDFTHINSLQETSDGNIVMSVRNFDEVVKISKSTGDVIWRIGGSKSKNNQYTFTNDTRNGFFGFSHQHSAQILPNGNLILLDNGWLNPLQQTRAVEYQLDHTNKTATKVWEYFHPKGVFVGTMGSVEVLPNGNRFVNFGRKYITEVRPDGSVAWELEYNDGNGLYHATRVIEYMDAVYANISSSGSYYFINQDYNTGVELQINSIQGQSDVSVEKHRYLPQSRSFEDTTYSTLLPYRWVINQYGIQSFSGKIKFYVSSIQELIFPTKARLYWRQKEGFGEFKEIECTFNSDENVLEANISKFGEFVIGVSILSKPIIIKPTGLHSVPISANFEWTKVVGARNYQIQIFSDETLTGLVLDTVSNKNTLIYNKFDYNTNYYWRVRALNEKDTSQWSDIKSFTTIISPPNLIYPINQKYGVRFYDQLRWSKVGGAEQYKVEITNNPSFTTITKFFVGIKDTFVVIPPMKNNTRYFWRVYAIKEMDTVISLNTFSFTTILETPFLSIPENNLINVPLQSRLEWNLVDGADYYLIQISETESFEQTATIYDSSRVNYLQLRDLKNEQNYFWRVKAARTTDTSDWSEVFRFRTEMTIPQLYYPMDKSENVEINPIFRWKEYSRQVKYQLQISKISDFTLIIIDTLIYDPYYMVRELKANTTFFWRVRSIDNQYHSSWSPYFWFKTGNNNIVQEPMLIVPKNGIFVDFPVKFMWTPSVGSFKYRIQISENSNFTALVVDFQTIYPEFILQTNLPKEYYYWRVKTYTTYDSSKWSDTWLFKPYNPNRKISLLSPPNGELQVKTSDTLRWEQILGADYYILDIATDEDFSDMVITNLKLQNNYYVFSNFSKGKKYFWRVKCNIKDRENIWSNVWSFTIETNKILVTPSPISPKNNIVGFEIDGKFEWESIPQARYYRLFIAKDTLFDQIVLSIVTSNNYYNLQTPLDYSEKYYWKVSALSEFANSKWSKFFALTTELQSPEIIYPQLNQVNLNSITEFTWKEVKDYKYFHLQISKDKDFHYLVYSINNIQTTKLQLKLEEDQTYYARIKAINYENQSRWSQPIVFSTGNSIVSVGELSNEKGKVFPNPVESVLFIDNYKNQEIILLDLQGNKIEIKKIGNNLNLENLSKGLYFLKIGDEIYKIIKE